MFLYPETFLIREFFRNYFSPLQLFLYWKYNEKDQHHNYYGTMAEYEIKMS